MKRKKLQELNNSILFTNHFCPSHQPKMSTLPLHVGDVVRLKSGSPEMTVYEYPIKIDDGRVNLKEVKCQWFDAEGKLFKSTFIIDTLEKVE